MELISIIVPIYKVEEYLQDCVESLVNQTYQNLEIILVDDGSPDQCPQQCDQWATKDSRIRVIHKQNGGLSDARNAGMKIAKGEYLSFVDSDDTVDQNYIQWLYRALIQNNCDISACDIQQFHSKEHLPPCTYSVDCIHQATSEQAICDLLANKRYRSVVWNKLYRASLLQSDGFEVGRYHEDEFFTYRILDRANRMVYVELPLYHYRQREGSIMATFSLKHLDGLDAYLQRLHLLEKKYALIYPAAKIQYCKSCAVYYKRALENKSQEIDAILKKIKACRKKVKFTPKELLSYSFRDQVYIVGTSCCLSIFCNMLNLRKGGENE